MILTLTRTDLTPDGVFGRLVVPGHPVLYTAEDDWRDNQPGVSCIPAGTYRLERTVYHKHGYETFEVMDVPGRSRILLHPGNTEEDTAGCILVGLQRGWLVVPTDEDTGRPQTTKRAVTASRVAFKLLMHWMTGLTEAELVIAWQSLPAVQAA